MAVILRNNTPQAIQTTVFVGGRIIHVNIAAGQHSGLVDSLTPRAKSLVAARKLTVVEAAKQSPKAAPAPQAATSPAVSEPEPKQASPAFTPKKSKE